MERQRLGNLYVTSAIGLRQGDLYATEIERLREGLPRLSARQPRDMLVALEVTMALDVATMVVRSALERTESRGAHFRDDYPEMHEGWLKMVVSREAPDGTMNISTRPLT